MTDLLKQRLAENKEAPYMAQHELVFELIDLEKKINYLASLIKGTSKLPDAKTTAINYDKVLEGQSQEINWLKGQVADLQKTVITLQQAPPAVPVFPDNAENPNPDDIVPPLQPTDA